MTDLAEKFFEELGHHGPEPLLAKVTGRVRFDLDDGPRTDSRLVTIDKGDLVVSRESGAADCTISCDKELFDALAAGRRNAVSSVLRGALNVSGEVELLFAIQRIFPSPPRGWQPSDDARSAR